MTDAIAGLPFWEIEFDTEGDPDPARRATLLQEVPQHGITDLFVFSHGWNDDPATARRLYDGFFGVLAQQHAAHHPGTATVGLVGVMWPAERWSDEPIPDFTPTGPVLSGGGGTAAATVADTDAPATVSPTLDDATLAQLIGLFPAGADHLTRMATLLGGPVIDDALAEFHERLIAFADRVGTADDDGESVAGKPAQRPEMLSDDPATLFGRFRDALQATGAELGDTDGGGTAGLGDVLGRFWNGAKEALRSATYWEMKNRAGVIGRVGLGPLLGGLAAAAPGLRVHLIGHSFGARLVSCTLAGLPEGAASPVASLTLLEGAFSHFAFVPRLAFDPSRAGALAGMRSRVAGPVTVCFSSHDSAVGTFYPLASLAAGDDSAGGRDSMWRWGGMGADGAQNDDAVLVGVQAAGSAYSFPADAILNVDASDVVSRGGPPSGAHSDIVHEELTWIVLTAAGLA
ncbi:MAG: serine-threonine protein kinase [Pseudonocardiales bacterium]|nr:serine-threonine protein kinase [Pseudonocardiales bacterium]